MAPPPFDGMKPMIASRTVRTKTYKQPFQTSSKRHSKEYYLRLTYYSMKAAMFQDDVLTY